MDDDDEEGDVAHHRAPALEFFRMAEKAVITSAETMCNWLGLSEFKKPAAMCASARVRGNMFGHVSGIKRPKFHSYIYASPVYGSKIWCGIELVWKKLQIIITEN